MDFEEPGGVFEVDDDYFDEKSSSSLLELTFPPVTDMVSISEDVARLSLLSLLHELRERPSSFDSSSELTRES